MLQALKREHPTPIPASTVRLVAVKSIIPHSTVEREDHTRKKVADMKWYFPCKRRRCKHYTNTTHIEHSRTRECFSRGSSLCLCLIRQPSSRLARHVTCAVDVVLLLDLFCTFHSHSKSDLLLIVPFTWR